MIYCVCSAKGGNLGLFLKSGDDLADVQRRAGDGATILTHGRCPARAVQYFFAQVGEVRGVEEQPVTALVKQLVTQAVGWNECPPDCKHEDIQLV